MESRRTVTHTIHRTLVAISLIVVAGTTLAFAQAQESKKDTPEKVAWQQVDCLSPQSLEEFIKKFPTGTHAEEARLGLTLQKRIVAAKTDTSTAVFAIPFETLGQRWQYWQKRRPEKGVMGYFIDKSEKGEGYTSLGWFSPLTGGKTPGAHSLSFDGTGMMMSPTGDGSIIAFRTNGLKTDFFGTTIETPGKEPIVFGVLAGKGLVYLSGPGKVMLPDGTAMEWDTRTPAPRTASQPVSQEAPKNRVELSYSSLVSYMQVTDENGVWGPPAHHVVFGPDIQERHKIIAKAAGKTLVCPPIYQDVAYFLDDKGQRGRRIAIFGYKGCPFEVKKELGVDKDAEMREETEIVIDDASGNVLWVSEDSARPLASTGSGLAGGCETLVNVVWVFKKKGTSFSAGDATYVVEKDGARVAFTRNGLVFDGVAKKE